MEQFINGIQADKYYELIEWINNNRNEFREEYGNNVSLDDLSKEETRKLYNDKMIKFNP